VSGGQETFLYAPDNKRVLRQLPNGQQEFTFYGARGEKLGVFSLNPPDGYHTNGFWFPPIGMALSFNGRKVEDVYKTSAYQQNATTLVLADRVGNNRYPGWYLGGSSFYPYGDQNSATVYDGAMFATYNRDSYSGIDYADQRYYASTYGRFLTADPYVASGGPSDPGSWNRYSYVQGDPVNFNDRTGRNRSLTGPCGNRNVLINGLEQVPCDDGGDAGAGASTCFQEALGLPYEPNPFCSTYIPPDEVKTSPNCDTTEIAYVAGYLSKRGSPLASDADEIVEFSDAYGIDDRFVVALAGAESIYGKSQQDSPTWGYYNAFSNGSHCKALAPGSDCYKIDPYTSFDAAIFDAISLLTGKKYFGSGLVTVGDIYKTYNRVPAADFLTTIYQQLVPTATAGSKVNFSRCP
jgi:RHS repeat-associated protein